MTVLEYDDAGDSQHRWVNHTDEFTWRKTGINFFFYGIIFFKDGSHQVIRRVRGSHKPQQSKWGFYQEGREEGHQAHVLNIGL